MWQCLPLPHTPHPQCLPPPTPTPPSDAAYLCGATFDSIYLDKCNIYFCTWGEYVTAMFLRIFPPFVFFAREFICHGSPPWEGEDRRDDTTKFGDDDDDDDGFNGIKSFDFLNKATRTVISFTSRVEIRNSNNTLLYIIYLRYVYFTVDLERFGYMYMYVHKYDAASSKSQYLCAPIILYVRTFE